MPLACWVPVRDGLTPHGLRHSHKTWMAEDGIPEILAEQRLGHQVPGMRGLYAHASQRMREDLTAILQARWERSLRDRAAIDPHSPVPLLDDLLAPFRAAPRGLIEVIKILTRSSNANTAAPLSLCSTKPPEDLNPIGRVLRGLLGGVFDVIGMIIVIARIILTAFSYS